MRFRCRDNDPESRASKAATTELGVSSAVSNATLSETQDDSHNRNAMNERATKLPPLSSNATASTNVKHDSTGPAISWAEGTLRASVGKALRIPSPLERDEGQ